MLTVFILLFKAILLTIWMIIVRGTLPRYKVDMLIINSWKVWLLLMLGSFLFYNYLILYFY